MSEALPVSNMSRVGMTVEGKYEVVRLLGAGGMGEVYEARHMQLARRVALKFLLPEVAGESSALLQRFQNEARAGGALQHENVAAVYDIGAAAGGVPYIVMEFLDGRDCAAELESVGTFSCWRAANTLVQVCRGLAMAHAHGIIHRDLKPANLFLCRRADGSELVKILDFGIAKLQRTPQADDHSTSGIFGTPFYMSPERARGDRDIDHRVDIYALGVILYELLSGERPYDGTSALQILHGILTRDPKPLYEVRRDVPQGLCEVVGRAMARLPEDRFASVGELEAALTPFAGFGHPLAAVRSSDLDVTMPEREPDPPSDGDRRRAAISGLYLAAHQVSRIMGIDLEGRPRMRRFARWVLLAFATSVVVVGAIRIFEWRFERPNVVAPAASTAIDRPDDRSITALPEAPRGEEPVVGVGAPDEEAPPSSERAQEPRRSHVRRSDRPAPSTAASVPPADSEGPNRLTVPRTESPRRLQIDRESPYR